MNREEIIKVLATLPPRFLGSNLYGTEEIAAASNVISSKSPFRYHGPACLYETEKFEQEICAFNNVKHALAMNSGTGGLMCALHALDVGPGDEVIIPGFLWVAVINAVVLRGAIPVLCEIDHSLNMAPFDLWNRISSRTKGVIALHMCGVPAKITEIAEICKRRAIRLIEDYSQAHGASVNGKRVGTFGDLGVTSLQLDKMISAGEGGLLITDDEGLYLKARARHDTGYARVEGIASESDAYLTFGEGRRLNEISSAILREQLKKLPGLVNSLRAMKERIKDRVRKYPFFEFRELVDERSDVGSTLILLFKEKELARNFLTCKGALFPDEELFAWPMEKTGLHVYYNCANLVNRVPALPDGFPWNHPLNKNIRTDYHKGSLPRTDDILERSVGMVLSAGMTVAQADAISEGLRMILDRLD